MMTRRPILFILGLACAAAAGAQKPSSESTPPPEKLLAQIGLGVSDEELARATAEAARHPLGTLANPVRVGGPHGERAYIDRLRCADGSQPAVGQRASGGVGAFGTIVNLYPLDCKAAAPGKFDLVMDMYHDGHRETNAPAGFALSAP
ncbi:hypothetical protein IC614_11385 [Allosphingosinicella flava]|uniref:Uncharacterized protein n=1 Tax=Allosphingosinicella flava TaxID=2771430 RepID=A0A7T2GK08_9SPHN|nr:hypothetical protein [Sphingosinicella flava]QPQ54903.1 hypothetical protein IC614_11385 [Sphingosinicella flava]